ncbi:MAG: UbiA family prenyltransferase [Bdellovibrionales bacterium]
MLNKSNLLHLRIPFSFYLMPIFLLALTQIENWDTYILVTSFLAIHLFLYPASQAYNSFYDRDEGSIGGLENPPKVEESLLTLSLLFDIVAVGLAATISLDFALCLFLLGLLSKAYSHPAIRLKAKPVLGWLTVAIFQGAGVYISVLVAFDAFDIILQFETLFLGLVTCLFFGGAYPLTQIYQHEEDEERGDLTISRLLGLKGTCVFALTVSSLGVLGFFYYFWMLNQLDLFIIFQLFMAPSVSFLVYWIYKIYGDPSFANFKQTMRMNQLSAISMILFCLVWIRY